MVFQRINRRRVALAYSLAVLASSFFLFGAATEPTSKITFDPPLAISEPQGDANPLYIGDANPPLEPAATKPSAAELIVFVAPDSVVFETAKIAPPHTTAAWPVQEAPAIEQGNRTKEPLGTYAQKIIRGGISTKWLAVTQHIRSERKAINNCRNGALCSDEMQIFLRLINRSLTYRGSARVAHINRAFNLTIRSASDRDLYGVEEYWASPLETLKKLAGDCEDIAIAKYLALQEIGYADDDLRLLVISDKDGQGHVVTAVRDAGQWHLLDNRQLAVIQNLEESELPLFVLDNRGARAAVTAHARGNAGLSSSY